MSEYLIKAEELKVGYSKQVVAENISFTVEKGDIVCVVGENGSGKSTLLKTLLGITKPLGGKISFEGDASSKRFGYLPQLDESQSDFPSTVYEIVASGCISRGKFKLFYNKEDKEIINKYMRLVGIESLAKSRFSSLSGGQRQRTLIARALCTSSSLLFLDEPLNGLDPKFRNDFFELVKTLHENGVTIVMISHDLKQSLSLANKILYIGEECYFGSKEDFLNSKFDNILEGGEHGNI